MNKFDPAATPMVLKKSLFIAVFWTFAKNDVCSAYCGPGCEVSAPAL
jgi:hypothetical protein